MNRRNPSYRKKLLGISLLTGGIIASSLAFWPKDTSKDVAAKPMTKSEYAQFLAQHEYNQRPAFSKEELKAKPKHERPDLAFEHHYLQTIDPNLGYAPAKRLWTAHEAIDQALARRTPGDERNPWVERGPNNIGGRTRALMYDPNEENKVWAGSVSGGLWYNNDITDTLEGWQSVNDFWDNLAVTAITADPNDNNTFYVSTGEGYFNADFMQGGGIWKTTDGGNSWNRLESTANDTRFNFVQKVVAHETLGLFASTRSGGLVRSTDGGDSWKSVLTDSTGAATNYASDIEIAADGTLYVTFGLIVFSDGIYKSTDGVNWTHLENFATDNVARIELAVAPSNKDVLYAATQFADINDAAFGTVNHIRRSDDGGETWTESPVPDLGSQAWYDLIAAVDPNNEDKVYLGCVNMFQTTNGGASWIVSDAGGTLHTDHHNLIYKEGSSDELVFAGDGGMYYSPNASSTNPTILNRNLNYNVTQYYCGAIHPDPSINFFIAGSQDNSSHRIVGPGINDADIVLGGDGMYCHIDQKDPFYMVVSLQNGNYVVSNDAGQTFSFNNFIQSPLGFSQGQFVDPSDYDDENGILYSSIVNNTSQFHRAVVRKAGPYTHEVITIEDFGAEVSHFRVAPYSEEGVTTLFIGTSAGEVIRVDNAESTNPTSVSIASDDMVGNISSIEFGLDQDEIIVTQSNYGVESIWYTDNGGESWSLKEANLPDMPVWWTLFNPLNRNEVLVATEAGVWATKNFYSNDVVWTPSNNGLAHTRVEMLQLRAEDNGVLAVTHGRGLFTSQLSNCSGPEQPNAILGDEAACGGTAAVFEIDNVNAASSYEWSVPNGWTIISGQGTTSITVGFGNESGELSVVAINDCDESSPRDLFVEIVPAPVTPELIEGPDAVCATSGEIVFSIDAQENTTYTWGVADGWEILDGATTNSISVKAGPTDGYVSVLVSNECGRSDLVEKQVRVISSNPNAPVVLGKSIIEPMEENVRYAVEEDEDAVGYVWTAPEGATIVSGQSTNEVVITFGETSGEVCVEAFYGCSTITGCLTTRFASEAEGCDIIVDAFPYLETFDEFDNCINRCEVSCALSNGWSNSPEASMDWTTNSGATPSSFTGPTNDITGGGNYLYTEATGSCSPAGVAMAVSPCFDLSQIACPEFAFNYHMRGLQMGSLSVEIESANNPGAWTEIFSELGNQGSNWHEAKVNLSAYVGQIVRLRIVGVAGFGFRSDMAIDQMRVYDCDNNGPYFINCPDDITSCFGRVGWDAPSLIGGEGNVNVSTSHFPGSFFPIGDTEVTYTAIDANGVEATCSFTVSVLERPSIELDVHHASRWFRNDGSINAYVSGGSGEYSYLWSTAASSTNISNLAVGRYTLNVSDANGCNSSANAFVGVRWFGDWFNGVEMTDDQQPADQSSSINMESLSLEVYPNPVANRLNLDFGSTPSFNANIIVVNTKGQSVVELNNAIIENGQIQLDVSDLASGDYLLVVNNNQQKMVKNFVVMK